MKQRRAGDAKGNLDLEGWLILNGVDHDVVVISPPRLPGPFEQPDVRDHMMDIGLRCRECRTRNGRTGRLRSRPC